METNPASGGLVLGGRRHRGAETCGLLTYHFVDSATTALVHGMTVVTRNIDDFATTGVPLLNPWEASR